MAVDASVSLLAASLTASTIVGMSLLVSTALSSLFCLERLFFVAVVVRDDAPHLLPMLTVVDVLRDDGPPFFLRELRVLILKI